MNHWTVNALSYIEVASKSEDFMIFVSPDFRTRRIT